MFKKDSYGNVDCSFVQECNNIKFSKFCNKCDSGFRLNYSNFCNNSADLDYCNYCTGCYECAHLVNCDNCYGCVGCVCLANAIECENIVREVKVFNEFWYKNKKVTEDEFKKLLADLYD